MAKKPVAKTSSSATVSGSGSVSPRIDESSPYEFDAKDREDLARIMYETNRAVSVTHSDMTFQPYDNADAVSRSVFRNNAIKILANPKITREELHQDWLTLMVNEGWRYGSVYDATRKEHPNLVPFDELDYRAKLKDMLCLGVGVEYILHHEEFKLEYWKAKGIEITPPEVPSPDPEE